MSQCNRPATHRFKLASRRTRKESVVLGGPAAHPAGEVVVDELIAELGDHIPVPVIERCVAEEAARFEDARITAFLPILIRRAVKQRLRADASWRRSETDSRVCVGFARALTVDEERCEIAQPGVSTLTVTAQEVR